MEADLAAPLEGDPADTSRSCADCGDSSYIYAFGRIRPRFSTFSLENEFSQVVSLLDTAGMTDQQVFQKVLSQPENRYIVRQLCWVFTIGGFDAYILLPNDSIDFPKLIDAVRADPKSEDMDIVVGIKGDMNRSFPCGGLALPVVTFDNLYSFDLDKLINAIPLPKGSAEKDFRPIARDLVSRIQHISENLGASDAHRALNYLVVRYPEIYSVAFEAYARDESLTDIYTRPSRVGSSRTVIDVVFVFVNRRTAVPNKYFVRVDVTEQYPFLVSRMSPYYVYDSNF